MPSGPYRLEATGSTPPLLFQDVASQLFHTLIDPTEVGTALREKLVVEGESLEDLLREWVNSLLSLVREQHIVVSQAQIVALNTPPDRPYSLQCELTGELIDPHRHHLKAGVSLLSCAGTQIFKEKEQYRAIIRLGTSQGAN